MGCIGILARNFASLGVDQLFSSLPFGNGGERSSVSDFSSPVVLNRGQFCPCGNVSVWKHFFFNPQLRIY